MKNKNRQTLQNTFLQAIFELVNKQYYDSTEFLKKVLSQQQPLFKCADSKFYLKKKKTKNAH